MLIAQLTNKQTKWTKQTKQTNHIIPVSTYLVTGGAGFIGSNIVEELLKRVEKVRVLDNFSTGRRENIINVVRGAFNNDSITGLPDNLEVIEGDIRSYHIVREAVDGVDFILHQAALPSVPRSIKDPITTNEVNVVGTLNILEAAKNARVERVVYASSSSVYGNSEILPKKENMNPEPISPYAVSKLAGEKYCKVFCEIYGLETVILRYFNVFGPRQDPGSEYSAVIPTFIKLMSKRGSPEIYGDGEQSRDFTYVSNVVEANLLAVHKEGIAGQILNIAFGERTSVNNLVEELNRVFKSDIQPKHTVSRAGEVKHSLADISKACQLLGYEPKVDFHRGLNKTTESLLSE